MKPKVWLFIVCYTLFSFIYVFISLSYKTSCAFSVISWRQMYWRPFIIEVLNDFRVCQKLQTIFVGTLIYHFIWCHWYVSHFHEFAFRLLFKYMDRIRKNLNQRTFFKNIFWNFGKNSNYWKIQIISKIKHFKWKN